MNAHMTEPPCLIGHFGSAFLFQHAFATLPKQFRPIVNMVSLPGWTARNPRNAASLASAP
jgi:hypothetical protein